MLSLETRMASGGASLVTMWSDNDQRLPSSSKKRTRRPNNDKNGEPCRRRRSRV